MILCSNMTSVTRNGILTFRVVAASNKLRPIKSILAKKAGAAFLRSVQIRLELFGTIRVMWTASSYSRNGGWLRPPCTLCGVSVGKSQVIVSYELRVRHILWPVS